MAMSPSWLIIFLAGAFAGLLIAFVLGALILQAASAFCGVENLRYFKALGLVLVLTVVNVPISLGIYVVFNLVHWGAAMDVMDRQVWAAVVSLPLAMLISGGLLCLFLSVSYVRGILIALMQVGISLVIVGVFGGLGLAALSVVQIAFPVKA